MAKQHITSALVQLLKDGHLAQVPATGISMYPMLHPGDTLQVKPQKPEFGDIVVFQSSGLLIAHRLIDIQNDLYICKGDSLLIADRPIGLENILGIVIKRIRKKKTLKVSNFKFKLLKSLMPKYHHLLARIFFYYARIHYKFRQLKAKNE